ncbi:glycosyltransferase family 39 protein [Telmatospirillum sp.]|uniref:ArnT family glycosyltransferase n=1 Tax=Telmatospirillum sp. TaxID=2079197 RepID=UPI00283F67E9|nr:glycosyltransferase family 39 protein [Telmatospirillum sp.]MDR3439318.1 glycosyltransferase family 39 protein [Telmatospirillum sp.]
MSNESSSRGAFRPPAVGNRQWGVVFHDLARLVLLGVAIMVVLTFEDYGITNDEEVQNVYGIKLLAFYTSFFQDMSAFNYLDLFRYGGFFDLIAAVINLVSPFGEYETRHLLGGLIGVVGLAGAWRLGRHLGGERVGFLALLLLLLTPAYYGHSFNNPKDAPFATAMVWTLFYLCRVVAALPSPPVKLVVKLGLTLGIALGLRVAAVLVGPYLAIGVFLFFWGLWRETHEFSLVLRRFGGLVRRLLPAGLVAYLVMGVFWPWGVMSPFNPFEALRDFSKLPINIDTLVAGIWVKATQVPRDYLPDYLVVNLPEIVLFGVLCAGLTALIWGIGRIQRGPRFPSGTNIGEMRRVQMIILAVAAFFPIVFFIFYKPTAYNGIRHFLFVVPPLAVIAAIGIDRLWTVLTRTNERFGRLFAALLTVVFVAQTWVMAQLHPDEYVYYNQLTGGVKGAQGAYELDYWGNSLVEATKDLAEYIAMENGDKPITRVYKVAVCGHRLSAAYFFPEYMEFTKKLEDADFLVAFTQANCHRHFEGRQIISVERFGVALSVVKDRRYLKNKNN